MDGGKPTVPENLMGTLTSSDYNFAHMSNFIYVEYRYYTVATLDYLESLRPKNYVRIGAFSLDSLRVLFYGETISIRCSINIKSLSLLIHIQRSHMKFDT